MKTKVLITRRIHPDAVAVLRQHFDIVYIDKNEPLDYSYLKNNIHEFDGVLSAITDKIDGELLRSLQGRLRAISNMAAGLDNIDVEAARHLGIGVFNIPGVVTDATADFTIGLALAFLRQIVQARQFVRDSEWRQWDPEIFNGRTLGSLNWGIVGFGRIGRAVAKRLSGFGTNIFYTGKQGGQAEAEFSATPLALDELLAVCDVISLHVPLTAETTGMIDRKAFLKMKKRPLLLNIARGDVVNTADLIFALEHNLISGAALDVVEKEPVSGGHPLLQFGNVLITPHIGTATQECRREMAMQGAANLVDFFNLKTYNGRELERNISEAV